MTASMTATQIDSFKMNVYGPVSTVQSPIDRAIEIERDLEELIETAREVADLREALDDAKADEESALDDAEALRTALRRLTIEVTDFLDAKTGVVGALTVEDQEARKYLRDRIALAKAAL